MADPVALTWVSARPDGDLVAIGDSNGRVRVWSPQENRVIARQELGTRVRRVEWTHDGGWLVAIGEGDDLFVYARDASRREATIATGHGSTRGLSIHPTKPWVATTGDKTVRLWDLSTGQRIREFSDGSDDGCTTAVSESLIAAGFMSGMFSLWEIETGQRVTSGSLFGSYVAALAFKRDGKSMIAGGGRGGLLEILAGERKTGASWPSIPPKPIATNSIVSDNEGRILCAHGDDRCSLFVATERIELGPGPRGLPWTQDFIVSSACFLPGTKLVLAALFRGELQIFGEGLTWSHRGTLYFDENDDIRVIGRLPRVAREGVEKTCAACGMTALYASQPLEECVDCGHIAPRIDFPYPGLEKTRFAREHWLINAPAGMRMFYVSDLFDDTDPRSRGEWLLRGAAEYHPRDEEYGRAREDAAECFEKALARGQSLGKKRGESSLRLSALYRSNGNYARAAEHCRRGLLAITAQEEKLALIAEAKAVLAKSPDPTSSYVAQSTPAPERIAILREMERVCPKPPAIALELPPSDDAIFTQDYLDAENLPLFLRAKRPGIWEAVLSRPTLLPALLRATDHAERAVQVAAIETLYNQALPRDPSAIELDAVAALRQRLTDPDERIANKARAIHEQIVRHDPSFAPRSGAAVIAGPVAIIGGPEKRARTLAEMRFAASLRRCSRCGAPAGRLEIFGSGDRFTLAGRCEWCASPHTFMFYTEGDPRTAPDDPRPSVLISAQALLSELERLEPRLADENVPAAIRERIDYCRSELAKIDPPKPPFDVGALLAPPERVADLVRILDSKLESSHVAASAMGRISIDGLTAKYLWDIFHDNPVETLEALREKRLCEWTVTFPRGRAAVEAELRTRFGDSRSANQHRIYERWAIKSLDGDGAELSRFLKVPDWAAPPVDSEKRAAALSEIAAAALDTADEKELASAIDAQAHRAGLAHDGKLGVELIPAMTAIELLRLLGWANLVGQTFTVHQNSWVVRIVRGDTTAPPRIGDWSLTATLDARPTGGAVAIPSPPGGTHKLGDSDLVRYLRFQKA